MKKLINIIIDKKYLNLFLFIAFAVCCVFLAQKVNINYEISEYLPKSSKVKTGLNIMDDEFPTDTSSFRIMFKDLTDDEEEQIKNTLENFDGVDSIAYDDSDDYHKDNYTLYEVTVNGDADSDEASETYNNILEEFKDYDVTTSGDVDTRNKEVLPFYVLVAAVACGTVILIIMCDSVVEVFLFLFTILIAVLLNKGTNIIFPSVSNITDSISAILQLALSMDYSIMLMNRYNQEKQKFKNNADAMKSALYYSFKSISSSSITTVVGLLALVFMSFTIGKDLGLVLAKGVLFSLISTFFVLPGLILIFDKAIIKTRKKEPKISFDKVAEFNYKFRYLFLVLFIVLFVGSFFLKGNLKNYFISNDNDEIDPIFPADNEIAIIYNNEDEDTITNYCKTLADNEDLDDVLCYGNTINEPLKYNKVNQRLIDLESDSTIDDYLLKLIYYKYYTNETNKISYNDFINFINNTIYTNKDIDISSSVKDKVTRLSYFTSKESINKARTSKDLSNILGMDSDLIDDLIVYYNALNNNTKLSLKDFITFMHNNVINDSSYDIDSDTKSNINYLYNIINNLNASYTSEELSKLLGVSQTDVDKLIIYYLNQNPTDTKLSINEFTNIIINNYDSFKDYIQEESYNNILLINQFSNKEFINQQLDSPTLSSLFSVDQTTINMMMYSLGKTTMSPTEFVTVLLNSGMLNDQTTIAKLTLISNIMTSTNSDVTFDYETLSTTLSLDTTTTKLIYAYNDSINYKLTPSAFIQIAIASGQVNDNLTKLNNIINNLNTPLTSSKLSSILDISEDDTKLIYGLYDYQNNNYKTISINKLIKFMCANVIDNPKYSSNFNSKSTNKLNAVSEILDAVSNDKKVTSSEMISTLSKIDEIDKNEVEITYLYYGSVNEFNNDWTMTIEQIVNYLNDNILNDHRFDEYIKDDQRSDIIKSKDDINDSKDLLVGDKYSRMVIKSKLEAEGTEAKNLIADINENIKGTDSYVVGNSSMAVEMSETFNGELNLITVLTMLFIFIVVAITFKSIIIPVTLVLTIQCAVFTTMGILSLFSGNVYFISLLIVQAILMGATIDYAIVYTSYYLESRKTKDVKDAMKEAYSHASHTIITSSLILFICTLVVAIFTNAAASKICETISQGTFCSTVLILFVLPGVIASIDKFVLKK